MKKLMTGILDQLKKVHHGHNWIGANFEKRISGLSESEFFQQPQGMHSSAQILSHLTTWRLETILKIKTGKGSITDDDPSNWLSNEELMRMGKEAVLIQFENSLAELLQVLNEKNDSFLDEIYYDTDFKDHYPYAFVIEGMLHHDLYHLGQLGLVIKCLQSGTVK